jgi:hypothetical protein
MNPAQYPEATLTAEGRPVREAEGCRSERVPVRMVVRVVVCVVVVVVVREVVVVRVLPAAASWGGVDPARDRRGVQRPVLGEERGRPATRARQLKIQGSELHVRGIINSKPHAPKSKRSV